MYRVMSVNAAATPMAMCCTVGHASVKKAMESANVAT